MKRLLWIAGVVSILHSSPGLAADDPKPADPAPARPDRPGRPAGIGSLVRLSPLFATLDANGDGTIDAQEIAGAVAALKKLDRNGDGKITEEEVRPALGRGGRGGPQLLEESPLAGNPEAAVNRLLRFDGNGDGKLSSDELPERWKMVMERWDVDKDGFLSKEELRAMAERPAPRAGERRPDGGTGRGDRPRVVPVE